MIPPSSDSLHFFGDPALHAVHPEHPVNVLFLTSVRDTGACDHNGSIIRTPQGLRYMEGTIERTINATREGGALHGILRVAGIVTDDHETDPLLPYPVRPHRGRLWIHRVDLLNDDDSLVIGEDTTFNIPSGFRKLNRHDADGRTRQKEEFERQVALTMAQVGADVLVSDHYMARIEHLMNGSYKKFGRVLNIHPAVTLPEHPHAFPGKTPTADAIERARTGTETLTGATLHVIDELIDHGPALAYTAGTPVHPEDEPQHLRYRNYRLGKLPLFIAGMRHYIERIYPHLDRLDLLALTPLPSLSHEHEPALV